MDPPEDIDDYLRELMEYTLGLPMSARTLKLKIHAAEVSKRHSREQCFALRSQLMERDRIIECIKALMNFKDQSEERRNKAESHVHHLEDETSKLSEELQFFKQKAEEE
ncbi:hypothetical protein R6Q57_018051 [Mikania cordata]